MEMESKLSQKPEFLFLPLSLQRSPNPTCLSASACRTKSFNNHFRLLAQRWRFQIQELSKSQPSTKHFSVHVVKESETLTSISKLYGLSIHAIAAANKDIVDVDLVFEGQHLNIPSPATRHSQTCQTEKSILPRFDSPGRDKSCFNYCTRHLNQTFSTVLSSHPLPNAKTTGYFLVMVPLIAFCIRCIIGAFHNQVVGDLKHQAMNESEVHHHGSRSMRWKFAISDVRDSDIVGVESRPESNKITIN